MDYLFKKSITFFCVYFVLMCLIFLLLNRPLTNIDVKLLLSASFAAFCSLYFSAIIVILFRQTGIKLQSFSFQKQLHVESDITMDELSHRIKRDFNKRIKSINVFTDLIVINTKLSLNSTGERIEIIKKEGGFAVESNHKFGVNILDCGRNVVNQYQIKDVIISK